MDIYYIDKYFIENMGIRRSINFLENMFFSNVIKMEIFLIEIFIEV